MTRSNLVSRSRRCLRSVGVAVGVAAALLTASPAGMAMAAPQAALSAEDGPVHLFNPNSGLCLNVVGFSQDVGTPTEIWNCLQQPAEKWQFRSDASVFNPNSGLCLSIVGNAITPGSRTEIRNCIRTNVGQIWGIRDDGRIFNPFSGLCLNVVGYATTPGSRTEVWNCDGNPAQKWVKFTPPQ